MIKESFNNKETKENDLFDFKTMIILSIATSIDALMVGITFALLNARILNSVLVIGFTTFCISFAGVYVGNTIGKSVKNKAEICGGLILFLIGVKILMEHLKYM